MGTLGRTQPPALRGSFLSLPPSKLVPVSPQLPSFLPNTPYITDLKRPSSTPTASITRPSLHRLSAERPRIQLQSLSRVPCSPLLTLHPPSRGDPPRLALVG